MHIERGRHVARASPHLRTGMHEPHTRLNRASRDGLRVDHSRGCLSQYASVPRQFHLLGQDRFRSSRSPILRNERIGWRDVVRGRLNRRRLWLCMGSVSRWPGNDATRRGVNPTTPPPRPMATKAGRDRGPTSPLVQSSLVVCSPTTSRRNRLESVAAHCFAPGNMYRHMTPVSSAPSNMYRHMTSTASRQTQRSITRRRPSVAPSRRAANARQTTTPDASKASSLSGKLAFDVPSLRR